MHLDRLDLLQIQLEAVEADSILDAALQCELFKNWEMPSVPIDHGIDVEEPTLIVQTAHRDTVESASGDIPKFPKWHQRFSVAPWALRNSPSPKTS